MGKNVMKLLKPSPHRARNDFDLSHRHVFDANFGELLPSTCIETVPGDTIELHASDLIRAIPFVSSPFLRAKQHLDVWFVPYRDLWHSFNNFITQKSEPVSAAFKQRMYLPNFSMYDLFTAINTRNTAGDTDVIGRPLSQRSYYLLELLGYGDVFTNHGPSTNTFSLNPFRLAAYNYIWYNEYRQQYYDDGTRLLASASTTPASLFNFDDLVCSSAADSSINSDTNYITRLAAMCQMRYRCWKKDLFTGVLPSTQYGGISTTPLYGYGFVNQFNLKIDNISDFDDNTNYQLVFTGDNGNVLTRTISTSPNQPAPKFDLVADNSSRRIIVESPSGQSPHIDMLSLRKSEAVQIWRENALRAGNHVKDNMLAHYGVASDFHDHRPTYLGSVTAPLNIGDIAATANSTVGINNVVGDIAGKGLSSLSEKVFKFKANDFGVIMVMFSMLPEAEYDSQGIDRNNQLLEQEDFFIPEYENLGLEAMSTSLFVGTSPNGQNVYGYAPRYYGYKTKLDRVFGAFVGNGIFRSWTSQRTDLTGWNNTPSLALLYVNPMLYDPNFNVGILTSPQFMVDMYFDVDAVRPMSVVGLPFS